MPRRRVLQMAGRGELSSDRQRRSSTRPTDRAELAGHRPAGRRRHDAGRAVPGGPAAERQHRGNLLLHTIGGPPAITAFARSIGDEAVPAGPLGDRTELGDSRRPARHQHTRALGSGYRTLLTGDALARRNASSSRTGCAATRRRACAPDCRRAGPLPTRPAAVTTAAPMTWDRLRARWSAGAAVDHDAVADRRPEGRESATADRRSHHAGAADADRPS